MPPAAFAVPEVGQAVRVRNRLATVRAVEPYDSRDAQGRRHIVDVEYLDDCRFPEAEQLLWEIEATALVLGKTSLPSVDAHRPDSPAALQAFVNAHRWARLNRLRESEDIHDEPLLGVWNSAIQVHPYQLEPVLRALAMPRVSLLLADGVGLGKTIQSGLVLEELLLRRRIRRILVLCPAMLQRQWKYELRRKFNLDFEAIDSDTTFQLRRRRAVARPVHLLTADEAAAVLPVRLRPDVGAAPGGRTRRRPARLVQHGPAVGGTRRGAGPQRRRAGGTGGGRRPLQRRRVMRLGHPVMRQAMATLCRQLHDPTAPDPIFRWSIAALHKSGFEALLAFHYTVTAINELREPLHDEVLTKVFRIEGDRLTPGADAFEQTVLRSEFRPIKSSKRQEEWARTLRGKWFRHKGDLEAFLQAEEKSLLTLLQGRADATLKRESEAAKESYRYRLRELQDRSRDQEISRLARELVEQQAEATQPSLFEDITKSVRGRAEELEAQIALLKQDVTRTHELLTRERDRRLKVVLPKRFQLREVRVLPLALVYLIPAAAADHL